MGSYASIRFGAQAVRRAAPRWLGVSVVALAIAWAISARAGDRRQGAPAAGDLRLVRSTLDGGGRMRSAGGGLELSGTVGQPDAGLMLAGDIELAGGFWFEIPVGDCEDDGDVDLGDVKGFVGCVTAPEPTPAVSDRCQCFDFNEDRAIDLRDFALVQQLFGNQ